MSNACQKITCLIQLIGLGVYIANIVYAIKLYSSSSKDPFEDVVIQNPNDYFNIKSQELTEKKFKCLCEQGIFVGRCSDEQKAFGCSDVSFQERNFNNINVVNFLEKNKCDNYTTQIVVNKKKLNEIFKFNMNTINLTSLLVLIFIALAIIFMTIVTISFACKKIFQNPKIKECLIFIIFFISFLLSFGNLIAFIFLCINYFEGDSLAYGEFLDCDNVKKSKFTSEFLTLEELRDSFPIFMILNIISIVTNLLLSILNKIFPPQNEMENKATTIFSNYKE